MEKTFHITTFGCQMNEHDSEVLAGILEAKGFVPTTDRKEAGVIILNTCSVRENADKRFFGTLGQLKRRKTAAPETLVCVCGCMMQQQHIIDTLKQKYPWVDIVFGTHNIHAFPDLLERAIQQQEKLVEVLPDGGEIVEGLPAHRLHQSKALVNIMYGCNNFCTYCIVPYTRGRERSRRPEEVVREIRGLVSDGVREVMLLGQNVNSYRGQGAMGEVDFTGLLEQIHQIDGLQRIRFMTSHPKDLSDRLIEAYRNLDKLCKNIHLPVQSGSDRILKRMNRHYTVAQYLEIVQKLREAVPDITMSTDIIVGFPGETEAEFQETLDLVEKVRYDSAFTFLYSIRKGTPAENYSEQIPEEVKHQRFNRLVDLVNAISEEKNQAYLGRTLPVLVEGPSKTNRASLAGRTDGFKLVNFPGPEQLTGQLVDVIITQAKTFSLEGDLADAGQVVQK